MSNNIVIYLAKTKPPQSCRFFDSLFSLPLPRHISHILSELKTMRKDQNNESNAFACLDSLVPQ